jgi:hypothetical protein
MDAPFPVAQRETPDTLDWIPFKVNWIQGRCYGRPTTMTNQLLEASGTAHERAPRRPLDLQLVTMASLVLRRLGVGGLGLALRFGVLGALGGAGALLALALPASTHRVVLAAFLALVGVRFIRDGIRA